MRIAALTIAFNDAPLIEGCIKSLKPLVSRHLFMVSHTPFYGQKYDIKPDNTISEIEKHGGEVVEGAWAGGSEAKMRNEGVEMLKNYDWIITVDADMWLTRETLKTIEKFLVNAKEDSYVAPQLAYWRDTDHVLVGDDFKPVIAIRPHVRFEHIGSVHGQPGTMSIMIHHLNWCEPKDVFKKVVCYSHAPEFDGSAWYRDHYIGWKPGQDAILPNKRFPVLFSPLPRELEVYLPRRA